MAGFNTLELAQWGYEGYYNGGVTLFLTKRGFLTCT